MTLLKLRQFAQLTLPVNLRKRFNLAEGDYLEAEEVEEGILLKPVTVVEKKKAWQQIFESMDSVQDRQPAPVKDTKKQEQEIAGMVNDFRKQNA